MRDLFAIWKMELVRLWSHKGFLFLAAVWPFVFALFFGRIYSDRVMNRMPVAIVDQDRSSLSRTLVRFVETNRSFQVAQTYLSPEEAKDDFLRGRFAATILLPRDFQRDVKRGRRTTVTVWINASNLAVANLASSEMAYIVGTINGGIQLKFLQKTGSSSARALEMIQPLPLNIARLHNPGLNYLNYLTPGIWAAILHQVIILLGALAFIPHMQRRETETLLRGVRSPWSLFWGKWTFYVALSVLSFEIFFRGLFPLFEIEIHAPVAELLFFSALFSATALSLGCVISLFSQRTVGALKGVLLLSSPAFTLSGYTFPLEQMPAVYLPLAAIFPLTPFISGYRKIYQEGLGLGHLNQEILHLAILLLVYTLAAGLLFKAKWRKAS